MISRERYNYFFAVVAGKGLPGTPGLTEVEKCLVRYEQSRELEIVSFTEKKKKCWKGEQDEEGL